MSMYEQLPFQPANAGEIDRLVADFPLATLVSANDGRMLATPLPLILQRDANSGEARLIGHLSRRNPQFAMLQRQPRALATFTGAQGYIASSWMSNRRYAPTWNYEFLQFELHVTIEDTPEATLRALELLSAHVEAPYPRPWQPSEMGPRFAQLAQYIVPFSARILDTRAQFKLGQGDPADAREDAYAGLARYGGHQLAAAMRRHEELVRAS
ncbi:FMN-binding negative transcriptional regulator [Roseateles asaccharophilus]|uniref:Transcriptional regulator n=1 Tax=Roseateles asaccharophilus TaxID=582607 RepID=A0ABU2AHU2_9BURK|nr:FMN-binding negative transcriptional regulator [Roseateles asaccharophilus]MDR7336012.1 transcriptional regulator [Roseateles asaccharophilus]